MRRSLGLLAASLLYFTDASCTNDIGCELNGVCDNMTNTCNCDKEWKGSSCGQLKLGAPKIAYGGPKYGVTSWGAGPPVKNPATGKYVLFATEIRDECGLSEWDTRSQIIKAWADQPEGPYTKEKVVIERESHNAYYVFDHTTGTHLIYHVGMGNDTAPLPEVKCKGGVTLWKAGMATTDGQQASGGFRRARSLKNLALDPGAPPAQSAPKPCGPASPCGTGQPMIHSATSLDGEWKPVEIPQVDFGETKASGQWATGLDNPAPFIAQDGSVLMLVKNYPAFTIWLAKADKYHDPYKLVQNAGIFSNPDFTLNGEKFTDEDPCIWQDHRGHFHAFFHDHRGHAFSEDGLKWMWGSDESWSGGHLADEGFVGDIYDTERPRVYVNPETRRPELLFYATGGMAQPTSVGEGAIGFTVVRKIGEEVPQDVGQSFSQQTASSAEQRRQEQQEDPRVSGKGMPWKPSGSGFGKTAALKSATSSSVPGGVAIADTKASLL